MPRLLSDIQDWQITVPYNISLADKRIFRANVIRVAKDWSKPVYKPIKDRIRSHYLGIQNGTCCYCRLPINGGTDNIELEHIIDKNRRLDFIFEPRNLVASCHNCNFTKKTKAVMITCPPRNNYPNDGTTFSIIHGHYDPYFRDIEFRAGSIYHGKTKKGVATINICGLDRQSLAEQREKVTMYEDDEIIAEVVDIRNTEDADDKIDALIEKLKALKRL
jgi:hypothetical protein